MPLGPQFKNTFFNNAEGRTTYYTDPASLSPEKDRLIDDPEFRLKSSGPSPSRQPIVKSGPEETNTGVKGVPYQGMLFDPYAHTGHRYDPTVPEETRKATIAKAMKLTNPDEYKRKLEFVKGSVSHKDAPKHLDALVEATTQTGIPTHFFENDINASMVIKKMNNAGGDYNRYGALGQVIRIRHQEEYPDTEWVDTQVPKYTHGKELSNPGALHDVVNIVNKKTGGDTYRTQSIIGSHVTRYGAIDEKGEQYTPDVKNEIGAYVDHQKALDFVSSKMPEGHGLNLWPGKGEETDEYTVSPIKMHMGYTDNGRSRSAMFHRRFEKIPTGETRTLTTRVRGEAKLNPSQSTIVHEIGHSLDPNVDSTFTHNKSRRDTVKEAIADGFEDRFDKYKDSYEDALHPSPTRTQDMKTDGYTIKDKSIAPTRMHAALYAAVRLHASLGDQNYKDIEARNNLHWKAHRMGMANAFHHDAQAEGNRLLLGHLYTTHAHVRTHLQNLGLDDEGEKAANHFRSMITDAGRNTHQQEALPGFEEHGEY